MIHARQFGVSTECYNPGPFTLADICRDALRRGCGVLEIGCEWVLEREEEDALLFRFISDSSKWHRVNRAVLERFDTVTVHAPFGDVEGMERLIDEKGRASTFMMARIRDSIRACSIFGNGTVTIHTDCAKALYGKSVDDYWTAIVDACRELATLAAEHGVQIGVENCLPVTRDAQVMGRLIEAVDCDSFGLTVDTGHFPAAINPEEFGPTEYSGYYETPEGVQYMSKMLFDLLESQFDRVFHFHLHDTTRCAIRCDHRGLGLGVMDFPRLFAELSRRNYSGTMVLETVELQESMEYMDKFLASREEY